MLNGRMRRGFTLVEMLVVVTVIGLIAATAALRLSSAAHRARLQHAIQRIETVDNRLRTRATDRGETTHLEFDLGTSQIRLEFANGADATSIDLGDVKISRFVAPTRETSSGRIKLGYSSHGTSESFAIELSRGNDEPTWLLFAGLTGQMTRMEEERDVQEVFRILRAGGVDAD